MSNLPVDPSTINNNFFGEAFGTEDFAPPRVSLGQAMSEGKDEGFFHFPDGLKVKQILGLTVLVPSKSRVLYRQKGQPSLCRSDNSFVPSASIDNPVSSNCQTCWAADFGNEMEKINLCKSNGLKPKNPTVPLCKLSYDLLLVGPDMLPFKMSFQSTALKVVREKLFTPIRIFNKSIPSCAIQFDMMIEKVTIGDGHYFKPVFQNFRAADKVEPYMALYNQFSKKAQKIFSDEYDQRDQENREKEAKPYNHAPGADNGVPF